MNVLSHHETLLYPFGFGLNYTRFAYGDLTLDSDRVAGSDTLRVRCTVSNAGLVEAEEVVQRYLSDLEVTVPVPIHKLVGFERVWLAPGERRSVKFTIRPEMLALVDEEGQSRLEPGQFRITVGGCSPGPRGITLGSPEPGTATFTVE